MKTKTENQYFKNLGLKIRSQFPQLHSQLDFSEGRKIYAIRLVRLRNSIGKIDPEYELYQKEFNAPVIIGKY